ncbi:MAG: hypothetical protein LBM26_00855 [Methanobrevibacter sp.]|jgi:hypothetical protein|nr:hypothetical protein [Methanobrevibacter sp.]
MRIKRNSKGILDPRGLLDSRGILFSSDYLLGFFLFILAIGMIINITDSTNDRVLNALEKENLEKLTYEIADYLITDPGTPSDWEKFTFFNGVLPGLAINNKNNETLINTVSYNKLKLLEENYDLLINKNLFNEKIKSSIAIYPFNSNVKAIEVGEIASGSSDTSNIIVSNRTVKCDYLSNLAILSVSSRYDTAKNIGDKGKLCNHNIIGKKEEHGEDWICREFKIKKTDLEDNNYYLLFNDETIKDMNSYWVLDNTKKIAIDSNDINPISRGVVDLNSYFAKELEEDSSLIFYLHLNTKNSGFESVLVAIPKDMKIDSLNIDYFKVQDCYFVLKTWY